MPLPSPPAAAPPTTSRSDWLLAGRYRVGEVIGRGGMSTVYRALDTVLDRTVAVKVLLPALAQSDPSYIARLQREARAAGALRHAAVVKIYDTGTDGDTHYIVMEYVVGQRLDEVIRTKPLETREAARISGQVAQAVAAAHAAGILHRDIKPANLIIDSAGDVKVLDFGIARTAQETTITQTAVAIGTASYMAPERVLGGPGDERSDIYAIGCLLYALLTGRPPFVGDSTVSVLHQQVHAEPMSLARAGARVPPGLSRLVRRLLAKDPAARPGSAAEVAGLLSLAAVPTPGAPPWEAVGGSDAVRRGIALGGAAARPRSRRSGLSVAALVLAPAIVAAAALSWLGGAAGMPSGRKLGIAVARVGARASRVRVRTIQAAPRGSATVEWADPASTANASSRHSLPPGQAKKFGPPQPPQPPARLPRWAGPGLGRHVGWQQHGGQPGWGGDGGDGGGD